MPHRPSPVSKMKYPRPGIRHQPQGHHSTALNGRIWNLGVGEGGVGSGLGDSPKEKSPHRCGLCGLPAAISAAAKAEGDARPAAVVAVRAIIAVSVVRAVIAVPVVRAIITVPVVRT